MALKINSNEIMQIMNMIIESRKELRDLEAYAKAEWGVVYWLKDDFRNSETAYLMEWLSASIHYDSHECLSNIHLN